MNDAVIVTQMGLDSSVDGKRDKWATKELQPVSIRTVQGLEDRLAGFSQLSFAPLSLVSPAAQTRRLG